MRRLCCYVLLRPLWLALVVHHISKVFFLPLGLWALAWSYGCRVVPSAVGQFVALSSTLGLARCTLVLFTVTVTLGSSAGMGSGHCAGYSTTYVVPSIHPLWLPAPGFGLVLHIVYR